MNHLQKAVELDIKEQMEEAATEYELALKQSDTPLLAYVNLACLYWTSSEPGANVPDKFFSHASKRLYQVLDEATVEHGRVPEIEFWRLYFNFISLGDAPFPAKSLELTTKRPKTIIPYFHVYICTKDSKYLHQVKKILAMAHMNPTSKNRYLISLLDRYE